MEASFQRHFFLKFSACVEHNLYGMGHFTWHSGESFAGGGGGGGVLKLSPQFLWRPLSRFSGSTLEQCVGSLMLCLVECHRVIGVSCRVLPSLNNVSYFINYLE